MICRTIFINIAFLLVACFLLLIPTHAQNAVAKVPKNLLLNPDANEHSSHWIASGDATIENAAGHVNCFSLRNQGSFHQEVLVPPEMHGKYAVLLGLASSESINPDGAITELPCLHGYMMSDPAHIITNLQGQQMLGSIRVPDEWGPVYGIFVVPPETTRISFFLNQAERRGLPQNCSAARFDDLGLYILPTMSEAVRFVQSHFNLREELPAFELAQNQANKQAPVIQRTLFIDWIAPPPHIADLVKSADVVVYVRVVANDGRGVGSDTAVGLTTVVLELVKASGTQSIGNKLKFWQEQWSEEPTPYPVGTHLILFLQEWEGRLFRMHGPYAAFNVDNGKLTLSKFLYVYRKYEGMRVKEFLQQLRARQP